MHVIGLWYHGIGRPRRRGRRQHASYHTFGLLSLCPVRVKCVLFTQVADTKIALKFWKGKLTQTKRASAMNGLLANFDQNHEIYADTTDMAIFFD